MDISREIQEFLHYHPLSSRDEIAKGTAFEGSDATMKRLLAAGVQNGDIVVEGKARATRYHLSNQAHWHLKSYIFCAFLHALVNDKYVFTAVLNLHLQNRQPLLDALLMPSRIYLFQYSHLSF